MNNLSKTFFDIKDFKVIECNSSKYVFFSDNLQLFKIENDDILNYFECCNKQNYADIDPLVAKKIKDKFDKAKCEGIQPVFPTIPDKINSLVLILTEKCNLRCSYCYAFKGEKIDCFDMDISTAINAVNLLFHNNPNSDNYAIVFFGGEPLLNYNLMSETVKYATTFFEKHKKHIGFSVITNGTILNDKIVNFFKSNNFTIQISFDGPKTNHDLNRKYYSGLGSHDDIMVNISNIRQNNFKFSLRTTIPANSDFLSIVKYMESLQNPFGFGLTINAKYKSKEITDYANEDIEKFAKLYKKLMDFYYKKIVRKENVYWSNLITILNNIENQFAKSHNCTAGLSTLSISPNGDVFTCQNITNFNEAKVGNINQDASKLKKQSSFISPNVNSMMDCQKCWIRYLCAGGCFYEKFIDNKDIYKPSQRKCEILKIQWENHLRLFLKIKCLNIDVSMLNVNENPCV